MSDTTLPVVDDEYVKRIFAALEKMDVPLDADPIVYGPKRLNAKVALCRQHLSRCQQIYLQVSNDLHHLNRALRQAKVDFDLQMQDLFANDPDVRSGKNVRDREAIATMKLRSEREAIQHIESAVQDLDSVMTVVKGRREDLKDVQGRIRDQVKLCQEEIGLGVKWGSAIHPGSKPIDLDNHPKVDPVALEAMNELMGDIEGESSIDDLANFVKSELAARGEVEEEEEDDVGTEDPILSSPAVEEAAPVVAAPAPVPAPVVEAPAPAPAPVVAPPAEPEPATSASLAEAEAEDDSLPEVVEQPDAPASVSTDEIDDFFNELELESPSKKGVQSAAGGAPPPVTDDIDLDDLIGSFK